MNIKNDKRPWGYFRKFTENESSTIKLINVTAGQSLSLQYHLKRSEFWVILAGNPIVTVGEKNTHAKVGDEFLILQKEVHRLAARDLDVQILEIAFGEFQEDDIIRIADSYGRKS